MKKSELLEIVKELQNRVNKVEKQNEYLFDVLKQVRHKGVEMDINAENKLPENVVQSKYLKKYFAELGDDRLTYEFVTEYVNEKEKRSCEAQRILGFLMEEYRAGWEPDWTYKLQEKYCIELWRGELHIDCYHTIFFYLSFPTKKLAKQFLSNFESLIKEYFML